MITHSLPETRPTPVMIPAPGASSPYMPNAASCDNSRNGEPGSRSSRRRSRGRSLPRATCLSRAACSPPSAVRATLSRRSATSAAIAPAFRLNSGEPGFSLLRMTGMSPAARRQPLVDLLEPVRAPEGLAVDDDVGRAERADGYRLVDLGLGEVLGRLIADPGAHLVGVRAGLRGD